MKLCKICTKCKINKPLDEYSKRNNVPDGRKSACKICLKVKGKKYYQDNKDKESARKKKFYKENRDNILTRQKEYYEDNKEKRAKWVKKKREEQPKIFQEYGKKYRSEHREKVNKYFRDRKKSDILFKLKSTLRTRLWDSLKYTKWNKNNSFKKYIGCELNDLKLHLESQFVEGMNWNNWSKNGWHIDHIIPLSSAKTEEELYKLCHYTNLQPLWAIDNLKKGSK